MYRIFETETFLASLEQDFEGQKDKIKVKLRNQVYQQLKESPSFGPNIKKLRNWNPPTWRYRIGSYRFFYEIDSEDKIVSMLLAEHRGRAYKKSDSGGLLNRVFVPLGFSPLSVIVDKCWLYARFSKLESPAHCLESHR